MVELVGKLINLRGCTNILVDSKTVNKLFSNLIELVPKKYIESKINRNGDSYHLTVISSGENKLVCSTDKNKLLQQIQIKFNVLGLGSNSDCYYLVCLSSFLDNYRKELNLGSKDFHITLGFNQTDKHDISKGIETIKSELPGLIDTITNNLSNDLEKNISILTKLNSIYPDNLIVINNLIVIKNLINQLCKISNYSKAIEYSIALIDSHPESIQSYYMYLKLCIKTESIDLDILKNIYLKLLQIEGVKQDSIGIDTCVMINLLNFKYNLVKTDDNNLTNNIGELTEVENESHETKWFEILSYDFDLKKINQVRFVGLYEKENLYLFGKSIEDKYSINSSNLTNPNYLEDFVFELNTHNITTHTNPNKTIKIYIREQNQDKNKDKNKTKLISSNIVMFNKKELPINFSKIDSNLYGSGMVSSRHIEILSELKINTIINLIGEEKPKDDLLEISKKLGITVHHMGFKDRTACGFELYLKIQEIIQNPSNITLIHCVGGIGRTNMVLSGYIMSTQSVSPSEAICILKITRKVIMVPEQIMFLKKYYGYLSNGLQLIHNPLPSNLKGFVVMMGLPCSGKSTLALEIYSKYSSIHNNIIHINQDEIGKHACEELLNSQAKSADLIILDRCNPAEADRIYWINMYRGLSSNKITIIYLNMGLNLSLGRLKERKNHLTLGGGVSGGKIIMDMNKKLSQPSKLEGWDELIELKTEKELEEYKNKIGLSLGTNKYFNNTNTNTNTNTEPIDLKKIIKFPRTKHIMNLGAMTRDDLLMDKLDIETMLKGEVTVEEKIDGANMGFRLIDGQISAQNRSHYVCSESHTQFKKLDQWIHTHKFDLIKILSQGNLIIYGEWLYSTHSITYTKLPDYFIMFDLYDIDNGTFYSRNYLERILSDTEIKLVPLIYKGNVTLDKLKSLVQTKSAFYDGLIEGVYVRSYDSKNTKLRYRAKIVRTDFISGNEHWTKGKQTLNTIIKFS